MKWKGPELDDTPSAARQARNRIRAIHLIGDRDGWTCNGCGREVGLADPDDMRGVFATIDHKDPNGGNDLGNLWLMCNSCNSKGSKSLDEWEQTLAFDGSFLARGFTVVPNGLLNRSDLSAGARLTLICLMSFAWKGDPFPGQERLGAMLGVTDRTVRDYLNELAEFGLIKVTRRGRGKTNVYRISQNEMLRSPASMAEESSGGGEGDRKPASDLDRKHSSGEEVQVEEDEEGPTHRPLPVKVRSFAAHKDLVFTAPVSWKVDRKPVLDGEWDIACKILDAWNHYAEQDLVSKDWLAKIVMRIREHPHMNTPDHYAIIQHALKNPWWKGPPNPSVVYGNGAQFERSIAAWKSGRTTGVRGALEVARAAEAQVRGGS